jgi:hypothetical protein
MTLPNAPGTPTFSGIDYNTVTVNWTAPTGGASSYKVERGTALSGPFTQIAAGITNSSFIDNGVVADATYHYRARATNANGLDGSYSSTTSVTMPIDPGGVVPGAPGAPTYTSVGTSSLTVNWTAAASAASASTAKVGTAATSGGTGNAGANATFVTKYRVGYFDITATSGQLGVSGNYPSAKTKILVYTDNAGVPGALIATSNERVGLSSGLNTFTFPSPFTLSANSYYWFGYITDTSVSVYVTVGPYSYGNSYWSSSTPYGNGPLSSWNGGSSQTNCLSSVNVRGTYANNTVAVLGSAERVGATGTGNAGANASYVTRYETEAFITGITAGAIYFTGAAPAAKVKMLVYADSAGSPGALIAASSELMGVALGWNNFTFASFDLTDNVYWVGYISDSSLTVEIDATVAVSYWRTGSTYANGPLNPLTGGSSSSNRLSSIFLKGAPGAATGVPYKIERAPDVSGAPGEWTQVLGAAAAGDEAEPRASGVTTLTYADSGLTANTAYWYRVRATTRSGDGPYSTASIVTTAPDAPGATNVPSAPGTPTYSIPSAAWRYAALRGSFPRASSLPQLPHRLETMRRYSSCARELTPTE